MSSVTEMSLIKSHKLDHMTRKTDGTVEKQCTLTVRAGGVLYGGSRTKALHPPSGVSSLSGESVGYNSSDNTEKETNRITIQLM